MKRSKRYLKNLSLPLAMVKILAFTDTHGKNSFLDLIAKKSKEAEIIVCCGDITLFEDNIDEILNRLDNLKKPVVIVHGNHESEESMLELCGGRKNLYFIHKAHTVIKNIGFFGFGGGGFSESFPSFNRIMGEMVKDVKRLRKEGNKIVFLSHAPPYNTSLDSIEHDLDNVGNKSIRTFIDRARPDFAFSGHIHENFGRKDLIKGSILVNPGPKGKIFEL
jgi:Icc-related predicted phosphoesterase